MWDALPSSTAAFLKAELEFFDQVTGISGKLFPVVKDERKAAAVKFLAKIKVVSLTP